MKTFFSTILMFTVLSCFSQDRLDTTAYYDFVEQMPMYADGSKDISLNYKQLDRYVYEQVERTCHMNSDSTKILLHFIVETDGSVKIVRLVKGVCEEMNQKAVAAIKNVKFIPGKQQGKTVRVKMAVLLKYS